MLRIIKTFGTFNLPASIFLFAVYLVYGLATGAPFGEHFLGMVRGHFGRGGGAPVAAWELYAFAAGVLLFLFIWGRISGGQINYDRTACFIFCVLIAVGFLMANLPHRVIFPEDEKVFTMPRIERALGIYLWCSITLFAVTGANDA